MFLRKLFLILLFALPALSQTQVFYTDRALASNPFTGPNGVLVPSAIFMSYAQVRICGFTGSLLAPCPNPATITDVFGNPLSVVGGNFGQLTTDVVGRFSFGCSPGLYLIQVQSTSSNTPTLNYPMTCPSGGNLLLSNNNIWTGTNTFNGPTIFNGSVTINGTLTITSASLGTLTSTNCGGAAAATGFIRLCNTDAINWRNAANNADEGLGTDTSDRLNIGHTNGIFLTGGGAAVRFAGVTSSFPMWTYSSTTLKARLADNSADAPITTAAITASGSVGVTGSVTASTTLGYNGITVSGACATGQVETATSSSAVSCQPVVVPGGGVIQASSTTNLGGTTAIAGSPSTTNLITKSVTMPASGCPCRVLATWLMFMSGTAAGEYAEWVSDATNVFATNSTATTGSTSHFAAAGSQMSPVTYANNAALTFTLVGSQDAGGTANALVNSGVGAATQASFLNLTVFPSSN